MSCSQNKRTICASTLDIVAAGAVLLALATIASGGIATKRNAEDVSFLYWSGTEVPTYTFGPHPFTLRDEIKPDTKEYWSFRQSRQFRPRFSNRRLKLNHDPPDMIEYDGDFGAKITTRRVIDEDQEKNKDSGSGKGGRLNLMPKAKVQNTGNTDQLVASSNSKSTRLSPLSGSINSGINSKVDENIRVIRQPAPVPREIIHSVDQTYSEGATETTDGSLIDGTDYLGVVSSLLNQSAFSRHAQLPRRHKVLIANLPSNGTNTHKKKEEYLVTKVQNAEIFRKASEYQRNTTDRIFNRLHPRLIKARNISDELNVESITVIPVPNVTSIIIRRNRTRLRVNRRPTLSFTVQNPFSIGVLQVNITPPEVTTSLPQIEIDSLLGVESSKELQNFEVKEDIEKESDRFESLAPPKVLFPSSKLKDLLDTISTKDSKSNVESDRSLTDGLDISFLESTVTDVSVNDRQTNVTKGRTESAIKPSCYNVSDTKVQLVPNTSTELPHYNISKMKERLLHPSSFMTPSGVNTSDIAFQSPLPTLNSGTKPIVSSIDALDIVLKNLKSSQNGNADAVSLEHVKNRTSDIIMNKETTPQTKRPRVNIVRNSEQVTKSASDFLFELPKSEADLLRTNRSMQNDEMNRFNEEQREIYRGYDGKEAEEENPRVQSGGVYFIGIIGVFPIAGGALYLAKIWKRRRRERLQDSDSASVTGFRRGNGLLHPLTLGQKKSSKGKFDGPDIISQIRISPWEYPRSKMRLLSVIGEGNFGQVWKAEAEDICGFSGRLIVAVKTVKEGAAWREKEELLREIKLMQQLGPHPNVVSILGCCTDHEPYYLIMEYVMGGRLLTFLRNHRSKKSYYNFSRDPETLTTYDLISICNSVAKGMEFIASKGIIHRDLAARNVLIDHNKMAKVADFGLSRSIKDIGSEIYEQRSKGALPIRWMAPESLSQSVFTKKSDVWSFGVFAWEVITLGSTPYPGLSAREVMRKVLEGLKLDRPAHCKSELYKMMTRCWASEASRRPDFTELKQELAKMLECCNEYVDFDKFHESYYHHWTSHKDEEKV